MTITEWERQLKALTPESANLPQHYEVLPGLRGPNVKCTLCSQLVVTEGPVYLSELVEDVLAHELNNH